MPLPVDFIALLLSLLCILCVAITLCADRGGWRVLAPVSKACASACFVALAFLFALSRRSPPGYAPLVVAGLVCGAIGDVILLCKARRCFVAGLVSFLIGHLSYLLAFARLTTVTDWLSPWSLPPLLGTLLVLRWLRPHLGSLALPVFFYMCAIVAMVLAAIALVGVDGASLGPRWSGLALAGALLFFVSDVAVAKARFVNARFVDRAWGLSCYYAAQLCIAWSLGSGCI